MAWQTSKRVWDNVPSAITKNDRLMLLALAECSDEFGVCWPGYERLAAMVGIDQRSAMRLVQHLEAEGQIVVLKQDGKNGGRGYTNLYLVTTGLSQDDIKKILEAHPRFSGKSDRIYTLLPPKKGDKNDEKGDKNDEKGDKNDEKGDTCVTRTMEPSIEPSIEPWGETAPPPALKTIPAIEIFIEIVKRNVLNEVQVQEIREVVGDTPINLEKWRSVVKAWRMRNYNITNISGMLDWFINGIPVYKNGKGHGDEPNKRSQQNDNGDDNETFRRFAGAT